MILLLCLPVFLIALCFYSKNSKKRIKGRHVMITGGSSGIGLKVAEQCLLEGANVTLLARDETKLNEAKESLLKLKDSNNDKLFGKIQVFSVDVSGPTSKLFDVVSTAEETFGSVYMLVNNAGFARAAKFEELPEATVRSMMEVNFMGSFFLTQRVVGNMKKAGEGGIIVFVSSQGGLFGIFGFTAYAASKGALVKFAEALHMEPGDVAKALIDDALKGKFSSSVGMEGFMLTTMCGGMGPVTDLLSFSSQVFLTGLFRIISVFYLWSFDRIISNARDRNESEKIDEVKAK
ncbi:3-ketodihydrosphingosine reductase [Armadillidium nasatum]|uniref:3-ketodihydrosphingosine reductase n=1 Tax=Armadillidium nasatum TaxID=96803 RepID=A0A5N5TNB3_9CRUS|nr:3-ketodihydrosphingosine reductase [Armadillidium nasatum]